MQDMIPPGERSIRNIPLTRKQATQIKEDFPEAPLRPRRRMKRFWLWTALVVVVCAGLGLLSAILFAGATVTLHPRTAAVPAPASLEAELNPAVGGLQYQTFSVSRSATTTVPATGTQKVSKQASGSVVIYNTYGAASQRLIANTRFAAPDGKIYKIHESVVVPGTTKKTDGTFTPGSAVATIYADLAGADYNRPEDTTFTIPGFKGDPRYTKFYAQSQGPISGGFVGNQPAVAAADLAAAKNTMEQALTSAVTSAASAGVPEGYIAVPGTTKITYSEVAQTPAGSNQAAISETATASGILLKLSDLASAIAKTGVSGYGGEAVAIADSSALTLSATSSSKVGVVTIKLSGTPTLVWQFDQNAVLQALLGKPKGEFETVLKNFASALDCSATTPCSATIRPFWSATFPTDASKISIVIK